MLFSLLPLLSCLLMHRSFKKCMEGVSSDAVRRMPWVVRVEVDQVCPRSPLYSILRKKLSVLKNKN